MIKRQAFDVEDFGSSKELTNSPTRTKRQHPQLTADEGFGEDPEDAVVNPMQWSVQGNSAYLACGETTKKLPSGLYNVFNSDHGIVFKQVDIKTDELLQFPDALSDRVMKEIEHFWELKEKFKEYGFLHRRGYLLYGPQGSGKSMIVQQIISGIIERRGIAILCNKDPRFIDNATKVFREVEPDRHIVCIFEDIDAIVETYGEDNLLAFLDGENQIDDVLSIATTNYPKRLDKRIIRRPRRFDRILKIDLPDECMRRMYFEHKLKTEDVGEWVKRSKDFSFAALADLVISVKCLGLSLDEAATILNQLMTQKLHDDGYEPSPVGFTMEEENV